MEELNEEKALTTLIIDLKKRKVIDNPFRDAECCKYLKGVYGSYKAVAEKLVISSEMIRQFAKIASLPNDVRQLLNDKGIDILYRISLLKSDEEKVLLAKNVIDKKLTSKDVRDVIYLRKKRPELTIEECIEQVIRTKPKVKNIYKVITAINEKTFKSLKARAESSKVELNELIKEILKEVLGLKNILSLEIFDERIILKLDEMDYLVFRKYGRDRHIQPENIAGVVFENWFG